MKPIIEHFRCRIYAAPNRPLTADDVMAAGSVGYYWRSTGGGPKWDITLKPSRAQKRIVAALVKLGWLERHVHEYVSPVDAERFSMFFGKPEQRVVSVTFRATERGLREWVEQRPPQERRP